MERKSEINKSTNWEKNLKNWWQKKGFEKLTIKMSTDAAGAIRPTFYIISGQIRSDGMASVGRRI